MTILDPKFSVGKFSVYYPIARAAERHEVSDILLDVIIACVMRGDIERAWRLLHSFRVTLGVGREL